MNINDISNLCAVTSSVCQNKPRFPVPVDPLTMLISFSTSTTRNLVKIALQGVNLPAKKKQTWRNRTNFSQKRWESPLRTAMKLRGILSRLWRPAWHKQNYTVQMGKKKTSPSLEQKPWELLQRPPRLA